MCLQAHYLYLYKYLEVQSITSVFPNTVFTRAVVQVPVTWSALRGGVFFLYIYMQQLKVSTTENTTGILIDSNLTLSITNFWELF